MASRPSVDNRRRLRNELLAKASDQATAAIEKISTLRGDSARKVANEVLIAAGDHLRAEHAVRMGASPPPSAVAAAVALLALDLTVLTAIATGKHPRGLRPAAAIAGVCRLGLFGFMQWHNQQVRKNVTAGLTNYGAAK
jgi:hypothetical protein